MNRGDIKALVTTRGDTRPFVRSRGADDERVAGAAGATHLVALSNSARRDLNENDDFIVVPLAAMRAVVESVIRMAFDQALAGRVAEIVAAQLGTVAGTEIYSTSKVGPRIPGKSRDWMLRHVKDMKGALKVGRDWQISRTDLIAWQRARDATQVRGSPKRAIMLPDDEALADEALRNAGYRPNGRKTG
jgi:hypothetical protein